MNTSLAQSLRLLKQSTPEPNTQRNPNKTTLSKPLSHSPVSQAKTHIHHTRSTDKSSLDSSQLHKRVPANSSIFSKIAFSFPVQDTILSSKLVDILTAEIISHGGKVFPVNAVVPEKSVTNLFYLISDKVTAKRLSKMIQDKTFQFRTLNYQYVRDCIQRGELLDPEEYRVFKDQTSARSSNSKSKLKSQKLATKERPTSSQKLDESEELQSDDPLKRHNSESGQKEPNPAKMVKRQKGGLRYKSPTLSDLDDSMSVEYELDPVNKRFMNSEKRKRNEEYWDAKKEHFVCQKGARESMKLNKLIIDDLSKLQKFYAAQKDKGRTIAYQKAVSTIKALDKEIKNQDDIKELVGIGPKIKDKIIEIVQTGKLHKVEEFEGQEKFIVNSQLSRVWGIGPNIANSLYVKGIKNIEDLRKNEHLLTKNQKIGLKYFEEFQQRIPRDQVQAIENIVKQTAYELVGTDSLHHIETCGSYRRGRATCGDIDIIITRKDGVFERNMIFDLVNRLVAKGLITDSLTTPSKHPQHKSFSYMGVAQLNGGLHRRIDIKYYPLEQWAFAVLYFTGSDMFNRSMRLFAKKKGYSLSDHGLTPVQKENSGKVWKGSNVVCFTQKEIFEFLGLQYKTPHQRDV